MRLAESFFKLYAGLPRAHGIYAPQGRDGEKNKVKGRANTVHEELTEEKWEKHLSGKQGLGVVPIRDDATVVWGAIDIDQYQNFDLVQIEDKVKKFGLPLVVIRTKSGGAHVTMFMDAPHSAKYVRSKLQEYAVALGYPGIEVFPKQVSLANDRDVGNWLNMPYFDHERTTRYAIRNGSALTAEEFIEYAESIKTNKAELDAIPSLLADAFSDGPPCMQTLASTGGFPEGTRNDGMFSVGVYCQLKHADNWEQELGVYNQMMAHPPLTASEMVNSVVKSLRRNKKYFYKCGQAPLVGVCNKELCRTRQYGIGGGIPDEPSLSLGSLEKIEKEPPTYYLDVEGNRVELSTDDILDQGRFKRVIFEKLNKLWTRLPDKKWDPIIQHLLNTITVVPAPPDASPRGRFYDMIESFCIDYAGAEAREEILQGKSWTSGGVHHFRVADLIDFMKTRGFTDVKANDLYPLLRDIGGQSTNMTIKGKTYNIYRLPEFNPHEDEDPNLVSVPDEDF